MQPLGTVRWTYGGLPAAMRWIHVQATWDAAGGSGRRSRNVWPALTEVSIAPTTVAKVLWPEDPLARPFPSIPERSATLMLSVQECDIAKCRTVFERGGRVSLLHEPRLSGELRASVPS